MIIKNLKRSIFNKTQISDKKINSLKKGKGWQGNGSNFEPIIIDDLKDLYSNLKIHRSTLHYRIRNLFIYKLLCYYTQNITIENCTIYQLEIKGCYNMTLINNKILNYKIVYSKGNTLIDNKLSQIQKLKMYNDKTGINPLGRQMSNPLTCCLYFIAISAFISRTNLWFIGFIPIGLLILKNYLTYYRRKRMRDKKENICINNTELQNKNIVLDEIINYYKDSDNTKFQDNFD
ncbi:MAG: hypothetical protein ACTSPN_16425 [Promethearchaeota archaeon]